MKLIIYTDGASRGNPGKAAYGFTISSQGKLIYEEGKYIGIATNNVAEYSAVLAALRWIRENTEGKIQVEFYADSKLVVEQLSGRYKIKHPHLKLMIQEIHKLAANLDSSKFTHVFREKNTLADKLANKALDTRILT